MSCKISGVLYGNESQPVIDGDMKSLEHNEELMEVNMQCCYEFRIKKIIDATKTGRLHQFGHIKRKEENGQVK